MELWCRTAHRRFWRLKEQFVDAVGAIEYWSCEICGRQWSISVPAPRRASRKSHSAPR